MKRDLLIKARKAAGKTQEQVAEDVEVERTTVSNWERGENTPQPHQRHKYADSIGISLEELDRALSSLPDRSGLTSIQATQYLGSEQSAERIQSHEPHVVHGLLQTPDYTAAIARSVGVAETPPTYVERNIQQRAIRQKRVLDGSLELHVVQSELALRLQLGDDETMATQLRHIVNLCEDPNLNVTVQVVPFAVGQYEALRSGAISVMVHPWAPGPSVYVRRYGSGSEAVVDSDEAANFATILDHAFGMALTPAASLAFIANVADEWKASTQ